MGKSCPKALYRRQLLLSTAAAAGASPASFIFLCSLGHFKEAFTSHFSLLQSKPPLVSHLLKACAERRSLYLAQQLHSIIITNGWWNIKFLTNHLMNAYVKLGRLVTAVQVFDKMPEKNVMSHNILIGGYILNAELGEAVKVFNDMGQRNSSSWNAVITGMINSEQNEEGLNLFSRMHLDGLFPDAYTVGSVLRGCAGLKDLITGKQVHGYVIRSGLVFDLVVKNSTAHMYIKCGSFNEGERLIQSMALYNIVACNTLISGRVQNGCPAGALDHYYSIKTAGLKPDDITFVSLITSCSELTTLGQGQQIHAEVVKTGAMTCAAVICSLISMYSKCGCLGDAVKAFDQRKGDEMDHVIWSSMISAYGFHGKGDEAIQLFNKMELDGQMPNSVTFLSLLYSCSHCGLKDKGLELFNLMTEFYKLEPEVKHYTCVVDLLGRAGCLEEAEILIRCMPVKPDAVIWKTLLSACKIHKNAEMAIRVAKEILVIDPQDSGSYVLLSNTQAAAKRWRESSEVRQRMRERALKKEPGLSWYELKNKVHVFITGDESHPEWGEIDLYLKQVMNEVRLQGYVPDICASLEEREHDFGS